MPPPRVKSHHMLKIPFSAISRMPPSPPTAPFGRAMSVRQLPFAVLSDNFFWNACIPELVFLQVRGWISGAELDLINLCWVAPSPPSPASWVRPTVSNHSAWRDENHPMPELVFLQVNLRFADSVRKPGENTRIIITATPGSQVALAAVDKSVYLLKGGNQLTTDDVSRLILYRPLEWDRHRTNDLLTDSSKPNHEGMTGQLTIWVNINGCLAVTIDGSKCTNDI